QPAQWLILMLGAGVVGAVTGLIGAAFHFALHLLETQRNAMLIYSHAHLPVWMGWIIPTVLCGLGAGLGCWLSQRFAPIAAGSGIPRVEAVLRRHLEPVR